MVGNLKSALRRARDRVAPFAQPVSLGCMFFSVMLSVYWFFHLPAPGKAVAVLGAVAVFMALRGEIKEIHGSEKILWILIVFGLLYIEIRAIDHDRTVAAKEQAEARAEQLRNFGAIAGGIDATIKNSDKQFDATMSRIGETLETSERTLSNTQPYATLGFQGMAPYAPSLPIAVGHELQFNLWLTNSGTDIARHPRRDARIYFRRPDNIEDEKQMAIDFDEQWKRSTHATAGDIRPHEPIFFSFKSDPLTDSEVRGVQNHTLTLYVLLRFAWSDQTGNWIGDECFSFQDPTHDLAVTHFCHFHNHSRYRAD